MSENHSVFALGAAEEESGSKGAQKYSRDEWESMKPRIKQIYVTEAQPLKDLMQKLEEEFGVVVM